MMTRRQILGAAGAASAWLAVEPGQAQSPAKRLANLGGAPAGLFEDPAFRAGVAVRSTATRSVEE